MIDGRSPHDRACYQIAEAQAQRAGRLRRGHVRRCKRPEIEKIREADFKGATEALRHNPSPAPRRRR